MSNKPTKVGVVPSKFNPNDDPYKYLQQFEVVANSNGWTSEIKVQQLPSYLTSSASLWYLNWRKERSEKHKNGPKPEETEPTVTWSELTIALQEAFQTVANKRTAEKKLQERKQQLGEKVDQFIYTYMDLCNDYDPNMSEEDKVDKIIRALLPTYLKKLHPMGIKTVAELVQKSRKISESKVYVEENLEFVTAVVENPTKDLTDKVSELKFQELTKILEKQTALINAVVEKQNAKNQKDDTRKQQQRDFNFTQNSQRQTPQYDQEMRCTKCGKPNHHWKNCWSKVFCINHNSQNHATSVCRAGNGPTRSPRMYTGAPRNNIIRNNFQHQQMRFPSFQYQQQRFPNPYQRFPGNQQFPNGTIAIAPPQLNN